jgi:hypothetical protein
MENISLENVEITYPGRASKAMAYVPLWRLSTIPEEIAGYPEFSKFGELPSYGFYVRHINGITFKNIKLNLEAEDFRPAFVFDDVKNLKIEKVKLPIEKKEQIVLYKSTNAEIANPEQKLVKEIK